MEDKLREFCTLQNYLKDLQQRDWDNYLEQLLLLLRGLVEYGSQHQCEVAHHHL